MDSIPESSLFTTYRRYVPTLLGAAASSLASAYLGGKAASAAIDLDSRRPITWSRPMARPMVRAPLRRRTVTRRSYKRVPRPINNVRYMARATGVAVQFSIPAAGSFAGSISSPSLQFIPTADLLATYKLFRIRKVDWYCWPRISPANSGLVSNHQVAIGAVNNPEGPAAVPTAMGDLTIQSGWKYKVLSAADPVFKYSFVPKVSNSVGTGAGAAVANSGSYARNPWLKLDATGITIQHQQLLTAAQTGAVVGATALAFDGYFVIHFEVQA